LLLGELYPRENEVILEVRKRRCGWPGFEVFVRHRLTSCWILNAMSPEIQEWSYKSRSWIIIFIYLHALLIRQSDCGTSYCLHVSKRKLETLDQRSWK